MEGFLYQATIYLTAAILAVPLAARLGMGSVLGYLLAGLAIGPILGLVGTETEDLRHYAEIGVVMTLFLIGLELEPRSLWEMRTKLLGLGGLQIVLTTALVAIGAALFGLPVPTALAVGLVLALSSTAIVLQTLTEKGLMKTPGGRSTFSVLLMQDIAVIPMLALLPLLALPPVPHLDDTGTIVRPGVDDGHHGDHGDGHGLAALNLIDGLPGWQVTLLTLAIIVGIVLVGMFLTRPLFRFIHMAKLREIQTAAALLIVIAISLLMLMVGLSPALGAFLAGVVLASSEFRHELEANLDPFKGLLLGLFFITVGAGVDLAFLTANLGPVIAFTLALMGVKGAVLYALACAFGIEGRDRWLFTLGLAQAGEFGFVLISFAVGQAVLPAGLAQMLLLVVALSMLLTPLAFIAYDRLQHLMGDPADAPEPDEIDHQGPVIIAGIGRFGQVVNRMVQMAGIQTVVLDHDLATIDLMRKFGFKSFLGDPTRPELLHAAGLREARVLVAALDDKAAVTRLVAFARAEHPDLHIVARAHDRVHVYELYRAGADDIVREMFDSSLRAGRYVLENMDFSPFEASEMEKMFYRHDRRTLRELADLWQPGVPVGENADYLAKARDLNKDLETALVATLDDPEQAAAKAEADSNAEAVMLEKSVRRARTITRA